MMQGVRFFLVALLLLTGAGSAAAQELEPGAYWPIPRTFNIFTAANSLNWGDVAFDPSLPVEEASATINTTALAYARAFGLAGRSANAGVMLPLTAGHLEGLLSGQPATADRFGFADPRFKLAMNLYGAPSMSPREFATYHQGLIIGVSLIVAPPLGQYDETKVINLGGNRWAFKPEIGLSKTRGKWVLELMAGTWLFTDNTNFQGGRIREQDPIFATQGHITYRFQRNIWLAFDANFYTGGRTTISGRPNIDLQRNSRIGGTFSRGLGGGHAIRASVSKGAYTTIGANFTSVAVGYNYAWTR
jgi:hypothetical protein